MERIGIYGGTFNPPHAGHFAAARYAAQALDLNKLLMIPAGIAPHKQLPEHSPTPLQRLEMVKLGIGEDPVIEASDLEIHGEGPSYTWQTVARLRQQHPDAAFYLLMGSDMFLTFSSWKHPERILAEASLAVLCRGRPEEKEQLQQAKAQLQAQGARVILLDNPITEISSTQLRRLLAFGAAGEFLPPQVRSYIQSSGLYTRDLRNLPLDKLEEAVVSLLKPNRVAHVLGCRQAAVELARRHGADETDAARAALLHDITKALDGPLQLTLCRSYGTILDTFSAKNPKTLHALTGSLVAQWIFGENEAVVSAIRSHTTGKADMNLLEKIIYVADYMEPNRDFPGVEKLRSLAYEDITEALKLGLSMTLDVLRQRRSDVSPESLDALRWLETSMEERKEL